MAQRDHPGQSVSGQWKPPLQIVPAGATRLSPRQPMPGTQRRRQLRPARAGRHHARPDPGQRTLAGRPNHLVEGEPADLAGVLARRRVPNAQTTLDGVAVGTEPTRRPSRHPHPAGLSRHRDSLGFPRCLAHPGRQRRPPLVPVSSAPPLQPSSRLRAALDTASVAVDRVGHVEHHRLVTKVGGEVGAADEGPEAVKGCEAAQVVDRSNRPQGAAHSFCPHTWVRAASMVGLPARWA